LKSLAKTPLDEVFHSMPEDGAASSIQVSVGNEVGVLYPAMVLPEAVISSRHLFAVLILAMSSISASRLIPNCRGHDRVRRSSSNHPYWAARAQSDV
jgi:hypothetical protein